MHLQDLAEILMSVFDIIYNFLQKEFTSDEVSQSMKIVSERAFLRI